MDDAIYEMSQWCLDLQVNAIWLSFSDGLESDIVYSTWFLCFAEGTSASGDDIFDQSSEGWLADCFNDAEMQFSSEDMYAYF